MHDRKIHEYEPDEHICVCVCVHIVIYLWMLGCQSDWFPYVRECIDMSYEHKFLVPAQERSSFGECRRACISKTTISVVLVSVFAYTHISTCVFVHPFI